MTPTVCTDQYCICFRCVVAYERGYCDHILGPETNGHPTWHEMDEVFFPREDENL